MNSTKTPLLIGCVILAMTLLSDCVTSYVYDDDDEDDGGGVDDVESSDGVLSVGKRSSTSALCRRCMFHRDDWLSCSLCYGKPRGIVPYYSKRSSVAADYVADDDDDETNEADDDKRTRFDSYLLDHRCCNVLRIRQCCRRGAGRRDYHAARFPDDFDGQEEDYDGAVKREYATSFFPLEGIGNGQCSCCDGPLLDYSCCSLSCSRRK